MAVPSVLQLLPRPVLPPIWRELPAIERLRPSRWEIPSAAGAVGGRSGDHRRRGRGLRLSQTPGERLDEWIRCDRIKLRRQLCDDGPSHALVVPDGANPDGW